MVHGAVRVAAVAAVSSLSLNGLNGLHQRHSGDRARRGVKEPSADSDIASHQAH